MIDVALPAGHGSPLARSFAACLASVTETAPADLPAPAGDLASSLARWRTWLAARGHGLVAVAGAQRFAWPGCWIAVVDGAKRPGGGTAAPEDGSCAVVAFGTPAGVVASPAVPDLLGRAAADLPVVAGYVVAALDPALPPARSGGSLRGSVEALAVAAEATGPMSLVPSARALAGRGLEGDRYAALAGTFTPRTGERRGYDLTLIGAEVLDDLVLPGGARLGYADARRNVVTRGVDVTALVGRTFRIGGATCLGQRLCEPCAHLERLTAPGTLRGLIHRGGLRADVLEGGTITTGDAVVTID